jgi:predicted secreted protein
MDKFIELRDAATKLKIDREYLRSLCRKHSGEKWHKKIGWIWLVDVDGFSKWRAARIAARGGDEE